jgi:hypothetical protein
MPRPWKKFYLNIQKWMAGNGSFPRKSWEYHTAYSLKVLLRTVHRVTRVGHRSPSRSGTPSCLPHSILGWRSRTLGDPRVRRSPPHWRCGSPIYGGGFAFAPVVLSSLAPLHLVFWSSLSNGYQQALECSRGLISGLDADLWSRFSVFAFSLSPAA